MSSSLRSSPLSFLHRQSSQGSQVSQNSGVESSHSASSVLFRSISKCLDGQAMMDDTIDPVVGSSVSYNEQDNNNANRSSGSLWNFGPAVVSPTCSTTRDTSSFMSPDSHSSSLITSPAKAAADAVLGIFETLSVHAAKAEKLIPSCVPSSPANTNNNTNNSNNLNAKLTGAAATLVNQTPCGDDDYLYEHDDESQGFTLQIPIPPSPSTAQQEFNDNFNNFANFDKFDNFNTTSKQNHHHHHQNHHHHFNNTSTKQFNNTSTKQFNNTSTKQNENKPNMGYEIRLKSTFSQQQQQQQHNQQQQQHNQQQKRHSTRRHTSPPPPNYSRRHPTTIQEEEPIPDDNNNHISTNLTTPFQRTHPKHSTNNNNPNSNLDSNLDSNQDIKIDQFQNPQHQFQYPQYQYPTNQPIITSSQPSRVLPDGLPFEFLSVPTKHPLEMARSVSELTMRSHGAHERHKSGSDSRRMAYYAVGRTAIQDTNNDDDNNDPNNPPCNRRCYFTGLPIITGMPFYAGSVQQGPRTLVVFCVPSALGFNNNTTSNNNNNNHHHTSILTSTTTTTLEKEEYLRSLPHPNEQLMDTMKSKFPEPFDTLPVQVRSPHCWRLFIKFCFFSGLPIAEGEMHYRVKPNIDIYSSEYLSVLNTVQQQQSSSKQSSSKQQQQQHHQQQHHHHQEEEIALSHDVMEAVNGEVSAEILRLPNQKTFEYLKKHYMQQSSKLNQEVFDRKSWEIVLPEI